MKTVFEIRHSRKYPNLFIVRILVGYLSDKVFIERRIDGHIALVRYLRSLADKIETWNR